MKKFLVLFSLVLFMGVYSSTLTANTSKTTIVVVDEDKCPKCGKEKCDGTCDANAEATSATAKDQKAKSDCQKSCDGKKKSTCDKDSKEKKSEDQKKKLN